MKGRRLVPLRERRLVPLRERRCVPSVRRGLWDCNGSETCSFKGGEGFKGEEAVEGRRIDTIRERRLALRGIVMAVRLAPLRELYVLL